jgi:simple sugar transport system permease protein
MELTVFLVGLIAATLRVATPLIFGTLGELFSERAGILNLGIEGTMFLGAFVGFAVAAQSGSLWIGLVGAIIAGAISGLLMSLLSVRLGVNQHVSGLGLTLLWTGLSLYGFRIIFGESKVQPSIDTFPQLSILPSTSVFAPILNQYLLTYIGIAMIFVVWWVIGKTRFGLQIRAVGENPEAADAAGLNVYAIRTWALSIGGALMAVGGAFLTLAQLGSFTFGIVAGRGWVCIALIIFANWQSISVLWGALLFGGVQALQLRLQTLGFKLPYELFLSLPYIVTIIALTIAGRNASAPSALLKAYRRE